MKAVSLFFTALILTFANNALAKELNVSCEGENGASLTLEATLKNANSRLEISSFQIDGDEQENVEDNSDTPVYKAGNLNIRISYGKPQYNSAELTLNNCNDSFESSGSGRLRMHSPRTWGGHKYANLDNCTCELK